MLGFIAVAMIPIPAMVYLFDKRLRGMSRYHPDHCNEPSKKRSEEKGDHNVQD